MDVLRELGVETGDIVAGTVLAAPDVLRGSLFHRPRSPLSSTHYPHHPPLYCILHFHCTTVLHWEIGLHMRGSPPLVYSTGK
jgi:hypothetical protein